MKTWILAFSVASAVCLTVACGDDDDTNGGNTGGTSASGGEAGNSGEMGGSTTGGAHTGGSNAGGGDAGGGDAGGAGGAPPVMCEPPEPPSVGSGDAGGASSVSGGAGGATDGVGGASAGAGGATDGVGGANGGAGGGSALGLSIQGIYTDNFDGHQVITNSEWISGDLVFHFSAYDNSAHFVIARNDQANLFNPCLWSRFDWTVAEGVLYYCQTAYDAESEAAALAKPAADASDLEHGCGNFSWSVLTPD